MLKVNKSMKIETWKEIAYKVQQLNFSLGTAQEFQENVEKLNILLQELGLEDNIGKREPKKVEEIGTSSLLQAIQNMNVPNNYKKATFYEKIYQLSDLGVQIADFIPLDTRITVPSLVRSTLKDSIMLQKCYTDGIFQLRESHISTLYMYNLSDLCSASYALWVTLVKDLNNSLSIEESQIILKNFNGIYPSKEEITKFEFPRLIVAKQSMKWGESPIVKEKFETFNSEEASYQKRLKRDANNQYYYE